MKLLQTARDRVLWTALGLGAAGVTAMLSATGLKAGWRKVHGEDPPENPISADTTWRDALLWSTAVAVGAGVTRLVAERLLAEAWRRQTGRKPPGL